MLGNFSFGGYFKETAIEFAWNFLTKELDLPKDKLIITHHKQDEESKNIWKKISGFSDNKIIGIDSQDNFWSMGDLGPCGPCSEIFFDNGENIDGGLPGSANEDGDRFVEIWNLVFMEYDKKVEGLNKLKKKCVDTGMGLERITSVVSGKTNNYDTDLFNFVFEGIEKITNVKMSKNNLNQFRIISDHIKSICMLMSEGVLPENEGRGYVLRRIIRRALIQVNKIKKNSIILSDLVDIVINKYSDFYFDLPTKLKFIEENLKNEEIKFNETLQTGLNLLNKEIVKLDGKVFPPEIAYKMYDTYGFPVDVTKNILLENNFSLDLKKYQKILDENKSKQKKTWTGKTSDTIFLKSKLQKDCSPTIFVGHDESICESSLICIIRENKIIKSTSLDSSGIYLVFDKTPFYAESGGQIGDSGTILTDKRSLVCKIKDTQKIEGDFFLHLVEASKNGQKLEVGNKYLLSIDKLKRNKIRNNHSATHLLHESLRKVLGEHVTQKGSLVNEEKLRFDFSYNKQIGESKIQEIEKLVNESIRSNVKRDEKFLPVKKAIENGAIALFGEKYPEKVRVISFINKNDKKKVSSIELCGGTHVLSTGQIGSFKILSDSSISSGVRRIEALTGEEADNYFYKKKKLVNDINQLLKSSDENILEKIQNLKNEIFELKKKSEKNLVTFSDTNLIENIPNIYFDILKIQPKDLKNSADVLMRKLKSGIIILLSINDEKVSLVCSVSKDLLENYNAKKIVIQIVEFLGGKGGGGREDMAQGGALLSKKVDSLKNSLKELI